ncbi:hypothetical protein Q7P37_010117 [Cladosporium fusiforme]
MGRRSILRWLLKAKCRTKALSRQLQPKKTNEHTPSRLLGLPGELRLLICEFVFADCKSPHVLSHVSSQLRRESTPIFYQTRLNSLTVHPMRLSFTRWKRAGILPFYRHRFYRCITEPPRFYFDHESHAILDFYQVPDSSFRCMRSIRFYFSSLNIRTTVTVFLGRKAKQPEPRWPGDSIITINGKGAQIAGLS